MTRSLITGATGFIGSHLAAALIEQGDSVFCLTRSNSPPERVEHLRQLGAQIVQGDVKDAATLPAAVKNIDVVYHLAGRTKVLEIADFYRVNETGASLVAEACAKCESPPLLVMVSSLAAAGPSPKDQPRNEDQPCEPVSDYGRSKRAGELAVARWASKIPVSIVRPPIVLGSDDPDGFTLFRTIARFGIHAVPDSAAMQLSVLMVDDLIQGLTLVAARGTRLTAESDATGEGVYFVSSDKPLTGTKLGQMIGDALGRENVRVVSIPLPVVWCATAISEAIGQLQKKPTIMNLDKYREFAAGNWTCNTERIQNELGFRPAKSFAESLQEMAAWYREAGWL